MIITKELEVGLPITNPIDIFTDIEGNLMTILVSEYEGKCFRSCYVKKILRIVRYSECIISQEGDRAGGRINVRFEAEAIVYYRGEIINGCEVRGKDRNGVIIASSPVASVFINADPSLATVSVGQIISVRVGTAEYRHSYSTITVNAMPLRFTREYPVWYIGRDSLDEAELELLRGALARMETEEKLAEEMMKRNPKGWQFFETLLYAYKTDQAVPARATVADFRELLKKNTGLSGWIARDNRIRPNSPNVYIYKNQKDVPVVDSDAKFRRDLSPGNVFLTLTEDYINYLRTIREMINVYNSEKLLADHKNIWMIFMKTKLG